VDAARQSMTRRLHASVVWKTACMQRLSSRLTNSAFRMEPPHRGVLVVGVEGVVCDATVFQGLHKACDEKGFSVPPSPTMTRLIRLLSRAKWV
jgi:hypothetical protein